MRASWTNDGRDWRGRCTSYWFKGQLCRAVDRVAGHRPGTVGGPRGAGRFGAAGRSLLTQRTPRRDVSAVRLAMGEKMVLGLEFFLAGDIIQTIVVPTWDSLAILGGIVAIPKP